ncbi:thiamine phosphate synthase [Microbacterium sp. YY-01]|uniref:thiamine phosphate synthase n=1 Tax=Microbacterium sp. YY-01 TaxID=3421634 RepID=UPI003D16DC68
MTYGIYLVTDQALCGERGVIKTVRCAVDAGVSTVQLRDKNSDAATQLRTLEALAGVIAGRARLLINDRLDVAVAARQRGIALDGLHVGQSDDSAPRARDLLGPDAIIGLTANTREHFNTVAQWPPGTVDYLGVGVIRPTSTKPDHPPALGIDGFAQLAGTNTVPCVAIGGVKLSDIAPLRRAGAAGVAVVSAICAADDARATADAFVRAWG